MPELNAPQLMKLSEVLSYLPNVQPRKAMAEIKALQSDWIGEQFTKYMGKDREWDEFSCTFGGTELNRAMYTEICCDDTFSPAQTSPVGASMLIELYQAGALPSKGPVLAPMEPLLAYAAHALTISDIKAVRRQEQEEIDSKLLAKLNDPASIPVSDFTYELLNRLFFFHHLKGVGDFNLDVGGISVTKTVLPYKSNSGKSVSYGVTFSWQSPDGVNKNLRSEAAFAGNRRNDPERNWGLHE